MKIWHPMLASLLAVAPAACDRGQDSGPKVAQNDESGDKARTFGELTVDQVAEKIGKPGVFVFDNNPRHEWEQGHVPGATWVDSKAVTAADLPADKNATLIFYCKNEHWHACHQGAGRALELGYTNVFIMPAGSQGWASAGKALEPGKPGKPG